MANRLPASLRAAVILSLLALAAGGVPVLASPAAAVSAAPAPYTVNIVTDAPADFSNDPGFTVCHTAPNNNLCSLRAAIMNANRHNGGGVIHLPAGTYFLQLPPVNPFDESDGSFDISNTVSLVGAGAANTIVDGGGLDSVFYITSTATVTMTGLTIRNGHSGAGGGIFVRSGHLDLDHSTLTGNTGIVAAGLLNEDHTVINFSSIISNTARNGGGGIENIVTLAINNSTIADNSAFDGGGIANISGGSLVVFDSTISNNRAATDGGGVYNLGSASFWHTTLAGNLADGDANNTGQGGGIFNFSISPPVQLSNSLLADNFISHTLNACAGKFDSLGYNLIQGQTGCNISGDTADNVTIFQNLGLAELGDYGGPTLTRALLPGSAALDRIPKDLCRDPVGANPVPDQRGEVRPIPANGLCDIGADEGPLALAPYFRNVVINGDAESSAGWAGSPSLPVHTWVFPADWAGYLGQPSVVSYNAPLGFPAIPTDTHGLGGPPGLNYFAGGQAASSFISQNDDLPPELLGSINAGIIRYLFSADLGGFGTQDDNALVQMRFEDSHHSIGPAVAIGPITSTQRAGKTDFIHVAATGLVPAGATRVFVELTMTRVFTGGVDNDGYADNISLVMLPNDRLYLPIVRR